MKVTVGNLKAKVSDPYPVFITIKKEGSIGELNIDHNDLLDLRYMIDRITQQIAIGTANAIKVD